MQLYPKGCKITKNKFFDFQKLTKFIPAQYREFYKNLKYVNTNSDDKDYSLAIRNPDSEE